ncbi:MAG: hypothetical protein HYV09_41400 [Deltaproteobacteria bacterium]|nr:hypothetical protein [Deltaproteobacteria bacterium]
MPRALVLLVLVVSALFARDLRAAPPPPHPELPSTGTEPARPLPPITVGVLQLYAYGADLLAWDGSAIVARTRLFARIVGLAPRDERSVTVTLAPKSEYGFARDRVDVVVPLDRPRPGRGFWSGGPFDAYLTLREARALSQGLDLELPLGEEQRKFVLAALAAREAIDRTNAFLPLFRGQVLARAGDRDGALKAFDAAADLPAAPFNDLLRVATMLEDEGATAAADRAFERGLAGLRAAGLRPERLQSQVAHQVMLGVPRRALTEALAHGDVARVDRLQERVFRAFPRVEGAPTAWRDVSAWMRARGREDLAATWSARADGAASAVTNLSSSASLDRILPTIAGMAVVAPLVALVVGLRRGARKQDGTRRIVWDLCAALAPLLATLGLIAWSNARLETVARRSLAPVALFDDGAASPDAGRFLDARLAPGPERDALQRWIGDESRAIVAGGRFEGPAPDDATMRAAFERPDVRKALRDAIAKADAGGARLLGFQHTLLAAVLAFVIGHVVGQRTPRASVAASRVVPGGTESLGLIGALLGGAFLGALFAFAGVDRALSPASMPHFARFFGLETIAGGAPPPPSRAWAWAIAVAYPLVHLVGVLLDRARASTRELPGIPPD